MCRNRYDYSCGARAEFLLDNGLERIGIVTGNGRTNDNHEKIYDERLKTFRDFMRSKKLYTPKNVFLGNISPQSGYQLISEALESRNLEDFPNALLFPATRWQ